jgi:peptide deformylase
MAEILSIYQLGNPVLREMAQPITNVHAPEIQELIDNLIATAKNATGVGIAAPQVAISYQLLIIASQPNARYPNAPEMEPTAIINPTIISHSEEMVKDWEGCLSVPGIRGLVPRYRRIEVEYLCRDSQLKRQELTDFVARIFQHEYDHLQGLVFLDRVETPQELMTEQEYQKQIIQQQG